MLGLADALRFDSATRLYRLEGDAAIGELLVEAWSLKEALSEPWTLEISALSTRVGLDLQVPGQRVSRSASRCLPNPG